MKELKKTRLVMSMSWLTL